MDMDVFAVQRQEGALRSLLHLVTSLFHRSISPRALETQVAALQHCIALPQPALARAAASVRDECIAFSVDKFDEAAASLSTTADADLQVRALYRGVVRVWLIAELLRCSLITGYAAGIFFTFVSHRCAVGCCSLSLVFFLVFFASLRTALSLTLHAHTPTTH